MHPSSWLLEHFGNSSWHKKEVHLPTHIVLYNVLLPDISRVLEDFQYRECAAFFHTHFPEGRIGSEVLVYCHQTAM